MGASGSSKTIIVFLFAQLQVVECAEPEIYTEWWFWLTIAMFIGLFYASLKEGLETFQCPCRSRNRKTAFNSKVMDKKNPHKIKPDRPSHILTQVPFPWIPPPIKNAYHEIDEILPAPGKPQRTMSMSTPRNQIQINVIQVDEPPSAHPLGVNFEPRNKKDGFLSPLSVHTLKV